MRTVYTAIGKYFTLVCLKVSSYSVNTGLSLELNNLQFQLKLLVNLNFRSPKPKLLYTATLHVQHNNII